MDTTTAAASTPVSVLCSDAVVRVSDEDTVLEVARVLTASEVGMVVVGHGEVIGVVSERDVVVVLGTGQDPAEVTAGEVASRELVCCDADATVEDVGVEMMSRYVRHVLVEADGDLVGVVSARDLLGVLVSADLGDEG